MPTDPLIHVVDDDEAVRQALEALLDANGCAVRVYESAEAFLAAPPPAPGDALLADVRMPGMSGLELQQELKRRRIAVPVVIVTGHGDVPMAVAALKAGAVDFIEKPFDEEVLLAAVREALRQAGPAAALEPDAAALEARFQELSPRECEVMDLVVAGHPNKVVAHRLGIAVRTVEIHRARVMEKTGARNLSELVRMAIRLSRAT